MIVEITTGGNSSKILKVMQLILGYNTPRRQCFEADIVYKIYLFTENNIIIIKTKVLLPQS